MPPPQKKTQKNHTHIFIKRLKTLHKFYLSNDNFIRLWVPKSYFFHLLTCGNLRLILLLTAYHPQPELGLYGPLWAQLSLYGLSWAFMGLSVTIGYGAGHRDEPTDKLTGRQKDEVW